MNAILENIRARRSVRAFTEEPIARGDLEQIAEAALWAPSGQGKQAWQFTVVHNTARIAELAAAIADQLGRDPNHYTMYRPAALVIASNDRDNPHGLPDCACALQNVFLVAHSLGLGSVWINQLKGICDAPGIRPVLDALGVPGHHVVWGMAALGHPAGPPPEPKPRLGAVKFVD